MMAKEMQSLQLEKLGNILLRGGLITDEQLHKALNEQKYKNEKLGQILITLGHAVEENIIWALSQQMGLDFVSTEKLLEARESVVGLVPEPFAKQHVLIAVAANDSTLQVAMADPDDIVALDSLQKLTNRTIQPALAARNGILSAIEQLYVRIRKSDEVTEVMGGQRG
jgi:hypothetical protein